MNKGKFKGRAARTKIFTAITVLAIVLLLAANLGLTYLGSQRLLFADLTPEGFYTVTDKMLAACEEILGATDSDGNKKQIKITFCSDPDQLIGSLDLRYTYYLALSLRNRFDNLTVETVNVRLNPTAVSQYKTTSRDTIKSTDIIFSYGGRYRIANAASFWLTDYAAYNGEYKMVTILGSLTAIDQPKAYFLTDHGESYYDPSAPDSETSLKTGYLADLLTERGLQIRTLRISEVDRIPEDCALLIINNPTEDFAVDPDKYDRFDYVSDTEKLDRYLVSHQGAIIVNKAYDVDLPVLESFLLEWGIGFGDSLVKDSENCLPDVGEEGTAILGVYDENTIGGAYYESYSGLSSAPKMVFTNSGYIYNSYPESDVIGEIGGYGAERTYSDFIYTSDGAVAYEGPGSTVVTDNASKKALAAVTVRTYLDSVSGETTSSYLFCSNTADFFSNEILGNSSYANFDVAAAMIDDISRTDRYASLELGGNSANSPSYGGKLALTTEISSTKNTIYGGDGAKIKENLGLTNADKYVYTIIISAIPLTVLVLGVVTFVRRRFL